LYNIFVAYLYTHGTTGGKKWSYVIIVRCRWKFRLLIQPPLIFFEYGGNPDSSFLFHQCGEDVYTTNQE
jgi:hypothetical protein